MGKFRLKLDMSVFFKDERRLAYILVNPDWEQVLQLQDHVQRVFGIPNINFRTHDGVFIPPREHISVIKPTDELRAFITHKGGNKTERIDPSIFDDKTISEETTGNDLVELKWEQSTNERVACSTPNHRPKKKKKISSITSDFEASTKSNHSEIGMLSEIPKSKSQQCDDIESVTCVNIANGIKQQSVVESDGIEGTTKSRKRKRVRKKKENESHELESKSSRLSSVPVPTSSSTLRTSKLSITPTKHLHFLEETSPSEENSQPKVEHLVFYCQLSMDKEMQPREIGEEKPDTDLGTSTKPKIQIQENILLARGEDFSCLQTISV